MNEHLDTILTFTGAEDKYCAESYKVSVFGGLKSVHSSSFSGKYMYLFEDNKYEINIGKLKPGKYTAYIKAMNPFAKTSKELKYKFEV